MAPVLRRLGNQRPPMQRSRRPVPPRRQARPTLARPRPGPDAARTIVAARTRGGAAAGATRERQNFEPRRRPPSRAVVRRVWLEGLRIMDCIRYHARALNASGATTASRPTLSCSPARSFVVSSSAHDRPRGTGEEVELRRYDPGSFFPARERGGLRTPGSRATSAHRSLGAARRRRRKVNGVVTKLLRCTASTARPRRSPSSKVASFICGSSNESFDRVVRRHKLIGKGAHPRAPIELRTRRRGVHRRRRRSYGVIGARARNRVKVGITEA